MTHWTPDGSTDIGARIGDRPAIQSVRLQTPGLHRISVETNPSFVVFDDLPAFAKYLDYEGLSDVLEQHSARGLPEHDIAEAFVRNARTLVQMGPAQPDQVDAPTGMPFEIIALDNPFDPQRKDVVVELRWFGEPLSDWQVSVFHLRETGTAPADTTRTLLRTDSRGRATVDTGSAGSYLLNAVRLDPVDGRADVVWLSHWASLTFDIDRE